MSLRVGIISLGCPRNLVDSESIISRLIKKQTKITEVQDAEVAIINTCAFIKEAKEESIRTILDVIDLKKKGLLKKVIVYGCLPQRYKAQLTRELDGVDAFVGRIDLDGSVERKKPLTDRHIAYVKISEGCGNSCSYCVIPKIKGPLRSKSSESIINEVRLLDKSGVREIDLVGQDITLYGRDIYGKIELADLVKKILKNIKSVKWIRLLYLHPAHISDDLIKLIAKEKKLCKYIDLPIQHCNNRILKLMNRAVTKERIVSLINKVRRSIDGVAIRTSVIVGFPSETDKEFEELLDFIRKIKFERLGAFMYSREEDTKADSFGGHIHYKTKESRFNRIMLTQQDVASFVNNELLGSIKEVMVDTKHDEVQNMFIGRLEHDAPEVDGNVYIKSSKELFPGNIYRVKITETSEYDLVGELT